MLGEIAYNVSYACVGEFSICVFYIATFWWVAKITRTEKIVTEKLQVQRIIPVMSVMPAFLVHLLKKLDLKNTHLRFYRRNEKNDQAKNNLSGILGENNPLRWITKMYVVRKTLQESICKSLK